MANIVVHIYNPCETYGQLIISWRRIFLLPLKIMWAIADKDLENLSIVAHRVTAEFVGRIVQEENEFVVELYQFNPIKKTKIWHNIYTLAFPNYKKFPDNPVWLMREGDYVPYIPMNDRFYNGQRLTFSEFLATTDQTEENFNMNEAIKYSGR